MLLNDVYIRGEWPCDDPNKKRLVEILQAFPKDEPTRKRFVSEAVSWSSRFGDIERGDPDIHHEAGKLYAEGTSVSTPSPAVETWSFVLVVLVVVVFVA